MSTLDLFLPCAGGCAPFLADEVAALTGQPMDALRVGRAGVALRGDWDTVLRLNLHSRIAQRVLIRLWEGPYRREDDIYAAAAAVAWEDWFTPRQTIKVEVTAQRSPLRSLHFAGLRVKDAVCDRLRERRGARPSVDTAQPDVRLYVHLTAETLTLALDTSGEPLFKRGWRIDKGDAPLKETLAAAVIAATGWTGVDADGAPVPLVDPCCGSGTLVIEAAQIALRHAPGRQRRFAFERLLPHDPARWAALRDAARAAERPWPAGAAAIAYGSDVSFRMVDFARRNAERAGVGAAVAFRGGDALQRLPPTDRPGILLLNPPYGERIEAAGVAGGLGADAFYERLAAHWKTHFGGWTAWVLTPDRDLPRRLRLQASRRIPLYNGPIECRLLRFDLQARNGSSDN
ncbi:THUMP domain-containing protein [Tepidimonas taiwanensis]|uniref:Ribosomal RNA large subunit methyltransferase L n=1 Tax=Tepidimonas taiwanensis TaxID=307486 RepID=A0A554X764_9BURK|nr:THUMP domain-containing protein [Tepidimonas taiwanensis]MCX7692466.1 THUMP domain-containing protein [Tepidimonas taiwanensis]MDM7463571.1 THUMP domain-containing protein [Tepidimonas taiwanensis]TSE31673.1 Ribosomal RNA large subunit methyltransferase L [Tepidimonas taiwanensis]UBQ05320.1 THUMP domain-containing protein [Tepidimonas taiwanensis]